MGSLFQTSYPQAWSHPGAPATVTPWTMPYSPGIVNAFNWPQQPRANPALAVAQQVSNVANPIPQQSGGGFNIAELVKALNAPSQVEQQHNDWVGAQSPSYLGNSHNPFNSGFFGAAPGSNAFSGRTVATPQALAIPHYQDNVAGAVLASPPPVGAPQNGNQTGNPIDYNAISALRQQALNYDPNGFGGMIAQQNERLRQQQLGGIPTPSGESGAGRFKPSPFGQWR